MHAHNRWVKCLLPLYKRFGYFCDETSPFQHTGDVIDSSSLTISQELDCLTEYINQRVYVRLKKTLFFVWNSVFIKPESLNKLSTFGLMFCHMKQRH